MFFSALSQRVQLVASSPMAQCTIKNALYLGGKLLPKGDYLEIELLLCHVLHVSRSYLYTHPEEIISKPDLTAYKKLLERRIKGEPIAYLIGKKEFWSLEFDVNEYTLIPRPETELLVELLLNKFSRDESYRVADLGVGCGAITVTLGLERPHWQIYGTDISLKALDVARRNAQKYQLTNIHFLNTSWCEGLATNMFDIIVSNPPYIAEHDVHLEKLKYEPLLALASGEEGLEAIAQIIRQAQVCLKKMGWLLLEHGYDQANAVSDLLRKAGYGEIKSYLDLNNILRVTVARKR